LTSYYLEVSVAVDEAGEIGKAFPPFHEIGRDKSSDESSCYL